MADETQSPSDTEIPTTSTTDTQLEYPQLLIEASFESLLSHSHSSGSQSITIMPRSEHSLSESWSSLSENDLTQDDDLQSDATDTGSLIDVSTTGDVHTVDDYGESSDAEEDDQDEIEEEANNAVTDDTDSDGDVRVRKLHHITPHLQESIRLDDSTVIVDASGATSLQASRVYTNAEIRASSMQDQSESFSDETVGFIKMSMSSENMKPKQRPYHILYHGSTFSSPEIKSDVLGKIGAALISSSDHHKLDDDVESPCYHVVPSEFGPGSRPSTADLIPIPTQMHISDCTVLEPQPFDSLGSSIRLQLSNGRTVVSRQASIWDVGHKQQWMQPDLCVIVVSQHEAREGRLKAQRIAEFSHRHRVPVLSLRQEAGWNGDSLLADADPHMLHKSVQSTSHVENKMLLDVDSFLALDTEQLNRHLNYITTSAVSAAKAQNLFTSQLLMPFRRVYSRLTSFRAPKVADQLVGQDRNWIFETLGSQSSPLPPIRQEKQKSTFHWKTEARAFVLTALSRTMIMVVFAILTTVMLSTGGAWLAQLTTAMISTNGNPTISPVSTFEALHLPSSVSSLPAATTPVQSFALSAPLQAIEQQVQDWVPVSHGVKKDVKKQAETAVSTVGEYMDTKACHNIVPAHIAPSLKVDAAFFRSGQSLFDVRVQRVGERITAKVEKQADGTAVILIKRKECYGQLTVYLDQADRHVCASIDLENSVGEVLTLWMKSLRGKGHKHKTAKRYANEYARILEVRTTKSGFVNNALELQYSAARGIGAAVEAVEKTAVKHVKGCHKNKGQCFGHDLGISKELSDSVQQVKLVSGDLVENTRKQIAETTKYARLRANEAAEHAKGEVSKAVQAVQSSIGELSTYKRVWHGKVTNKLAEAQHRARGLVKKSRVHGKKVRGSG